MVCPYCGGTIEMDYTDSYGWCDTCDTCVIAGQLELAKEAGGENMDTGSNKLPRQLEGVELGCIPCTSYELKKPEHGMGYAPTYICTKGRDPKECEVSKKNAEKK